MATKKPEDLKAKVKAVAENPGVKEALAKDGLEINQKELHKVTETAAPATPRQSAIERRLEQIRLRKAELELEIMEDQVRKLNAEKAMRRIQMRDRELALDETAKHQEAMQSICNHRKGGEKEDALLQGAGTNQNNMAVIKHTYPWGETQVMCSRCRKVWAPGDEGYQEALRWPTSNQPSGTQLFFIQNGPRTIKQWDQVQREKWDKALADEQANALTEASA
jgi:hypothetical protein